MSRSSRSLSYQLTWIMTKQRRLQYEQQSNSCDCAPRRHWSHGHDKQANRINRSCSACTSLTQLQRELECVRWLVCSVH